MYESSVTLLFVEPVLRLMMGGDRDEMCGGEGEGRLREWGGGRNQIKVVLHVRVQ